MLLEAKSVNASFDANPVLHDIDLEVASGEVVCLIGSNGAGKSTLLHTLTGVVRAVSGRISFGGHEIQKESTSAIVKRGLSLVPEGRRVFAPLTVKENLHIGAYTRRNTDEIARDLDWVLQVFPKLKERLPQAAGTLSGGEQQMLAIARALMSRPVLLLLDEPSLGLAPKIVSEIFAKISELRDAGMSVLIAEQNASVALEFSNRGYVLNEGKVAVSGPTERLKGNDDVRRIYLGI